MRIVGGVWFRDPLPLSYSLPPPPETTPPYSRKGKYVAVMALPVPDVTVGEGLEHPVHMPVPRRRGVMVHQCRVVVPQGAKHTGRPSHAQDHSGTVMCSGKFRLPPPPGRENSLPALRFKGPIYTRKGWGSVFAGGSRKLSRRRSKISWWGTGF